jgi:hypothetical protein
MAMIKESPDAATAIMTEETMDTGRAADLAINNWAEHLDVRP